MRLPSYAPAASRRPELEPLTIGSPAASAIYEMWSGASSVDLVIADHYDRLDCAVTIAAHLVARARCNVYLVLCDPAADRYLALEYAADQLPANSITCQIDPDGTTSPARVRWSTRANPTGRQLFISASDSHLGIGSDVCVVVAGSDGAVENVGGLTVRLSASGAPPRHEYRRVGPSWGDVPLDVVIAGTPEDCPDADRTN